MSKNSICRKTYVYVYAYVSSRRILFLSKNITYIGICKHIYTRTYIYIYTNIDIQIYIMLILCIRKGDKIFAIHILLHKETLEKCLPTVSRRSGADEVGVLIFT